MACSQEQVCLTSEEKDPDRKDPYIVTFYEFNQNLADHIIFPKYTTCGDHLDGIKSFIIVGMNFNVFRKNLAH